MASLTTNNTTTDTDSDPTNDRTNIAFQTLIANCHKWNEWLEDAAHWDTNGRLILPKGNKPRNGPERPEAEKSLCRWRNNVGTRDKKGNVDDATKSAMKEVFGEKNDQFFWQKRGGGGIDMSEESNWFFRGSGYVEITATAIKNLTAWGLWDNDGKNEKNCLQGGPAPTSKLNNKLYQFQRSAHNRDKVSRWFDKGISREKNRAKIIELAGEGFFRFGRQKGKSKNSAKESSNDLPDQMSSLSVNDDGETKEVFEISNSNDLIGKWGVVGRWCGSGAVSEIDVFKNKDAIDYFNDKESEACLPRFSEYVPMLSVEEAQRLVEPLRGLALSEVEGGWTPMKQEIVSKTFSSFEKEKKKMMDEDDEFDTKNFDEPKHTLPAGSEVGVIVFTQLDDGYNTSNFYDVDTMSFLLSKENLTSFLLSVGYSDVDTSSENLLFESRICRVLTREDCVDGDGCNKFEVVGDY